MNRLITNRLRFFSLSLSLFRGIVGKWKFPSPRFREPGKLAGFVVAGLLMAVFVAAFTGPGSNQPGSGSPTFWRLNGSNMYYSAGSVGIGTTTPIYGLDVVGGLRATATSTFSGNVGVGTSTPDAATTNSGTTLHIVHSGDKYPFVVIERTGGGSWTNRKWGLYPDALGSFAIRDISTGGTDRVVVDTSGNVGIGRQPASGRRLSIKSNSGSPALWLEKPDADGEIMNFMSDNVERGNITISGSTVSYNAFTGSHYAWAGEFIEPGMLVSLTGENRQYHDNPTSEIVYGVRKTTAINDPAIAGVFLSIMNPYEEASTANPLLVAAVGNGEVWVVDTGRDLKPGDYLISSGVPGHAMVEDGTYPHPNLIARIAERVVWSTVADTVDDNGVPRRHKKISILFAPGRF